MKNKKQYQWDRLNRNWSIERIVETKVNDYRVNK